MKAQTVIWGAANSVLYMQLKRHSDFCCYHRYFNYRTTRFLAEEGFYKFHNWFDDRAWYPLGRIIGGTIYPGKMMFRTLSFFKTGWKVLERMGNTCHASSRMVVVFCQTYLEQIKILLVLKRLYLAVWRSGIAPCWMRFDSYFQVLHLLVLFFCIWKICDFLPMEHLSFPLFQV